MFDFKKLEENKIILDDETYERYSQNPVAQKLIPILDVFAQADSAKYGKVLSALVNEISLTIADYLMFDYIDGDINIDDEFENIIQTYAYVNNRIVRSAINLTGGNVNV